MDNWITIAVAGLLTLFFLLRYVASMKRREKLAREAAQRGELYSDGPKAQHPHIDNKYCIGDPACMACSPNAECLLDVNVNQSRCICKQGFSGDGKTCVAQCTPACGANALEVLDALRQRVGLNRSDISSGHGRDPVMTNTQGRMTTEARMPKDE